MTDPRILGDMERLARSGEAISLTLRRIADSLGVLSGTHATSTTTAFANALLDLVEIEGSECAHGYGPAARCPEPDCAWHPLRPIMVEASKVTGRGLVRGSMDRELAGPDALDSAGGLDA